MAQFILVLTLLFSSPPEGHVPTAYRAYLAGSTWRYSPVDNKEVQTRILFTPDHRMWLSPPETNYWLGYKIDSMGVHGSELLIHSHLNAGDKDQFFRLEPKRLNKMLLTFHGKSFVFFRVN